jgi:glycosyltransferase involved in cell wall biosynthesis
MMISIIVPVHNGAKFIAEALQSIFNQTFKDYEIIVIDDGSTDETRQIVEKYRDSVAYFYQENAGAGVARNLGVEKTCGDFIAFLDADDYWTVDKLEKQYNYLLANNEVDAVFGYAEQISQADWKTKDVTEKSPDKALASYLPSAMLIRRKSFYRAGFYPIEYQVGEVVEWYLKAQEAGLNMILLPDLVYWRRIHSDNLGIRHKSSIGDYVKIVKRSMERRRQIKNSNVFLER